MFSDSKIKQNFEVNEGKLRYRIKYRLALHFKSILQKRHRKFSFVVSFDVSWNSKTKEWQLDLVNQFLFKKTLEKLKHTSISNLMVILLQTIFWNIFVNH